MCVSASGVAGVSGLFERAEAFVDFGKGDFVDNGGGIDLGCPCAQLVEGRGVGVVGGVGVEFLCHFAEGFLFVGWSEVRVQGAECYAPTSRQRFGGCSGTLGFPEWFFVSFFGKDLCLSLEELLHQEGPLRCFGCSETGLDCRAVGMVVGVNTDALCEAWPCIMKDESRKVQGEESVEFDDSNIARFEGENHVPDGCSVEIGETGAQATWSPV